jgi:hypothetical protein
MFVDPRRLFRTPSFLPDDEALMAGGGAPPPMPQPPTLPRRQADLSASQPPASVISNMPPTNHPVADMSARLAPPRPAPQPQFADGAPEMYQARPSMPQAATPPPPPPSQWSQNAPPPMPAAPPQQTAMDRLRGMKPPEMPKAPIWKQIVGSYAGNFLGPKIGARIAFGGDHVDAVDNFNRDRKFLTEQAGFEHQAKQDELSELQKRSYASNIDSLDASRRATEEDRERKFVESLGEEAPEGLVDHERYSYRDYNGKKYRQLTPGGKAAQEQEVKQKDWPTATPQMEQKYGQYGFKAGQKVDPARITQLIGIEEQNGRAAEANALKEVLSKQADTTRMAIAGMAQANRNQTASTVLDERSYRKADAQGKRFASMPEVKQYNDVAPFIENIRAHAQKPNDSMSQLAVLYNYIKVNDPGSVVREGEVALVREGESLVSNAQRMYNKVIQGGVVSPQLIRSIADSAEATYKVTHDRYKNKMRQFRDVVRKNNLDEEIVFGKTSGEIDADLGGQTAGGAAPASAPIVQRSPSTGQYRHSLDGGKTWLPGQPQKR